jgi:hypothetical protein
MNDPAVKEFMEKYGMGNMTEMMKNSNHMKGMSGMMGKMG